MGVRVLGFRGPSISEAREVPAFRFAFREEWNILKEECLSCPHERELLSHSAVQDGGLFN